MDGTFVVFFSRRTEIHITGTKNYHYDRKYVIRLCSKNYYLVVVDNNFITKSNYFLLILGFYIRKLLDLKETLLIKFFRKHL